MKSTEEAWERVRELEAGLVALALARERQMHRPIRERDLGALLLIAKEVEVLEAGIRELRWAFGDHE